MSRISRILCGTPLLLSAALLLEGSALPPTPRGDAEPPSACAAPEGREVPRVDERNHRLFVIATVEELEKREQAVQLLQRLAEHVARCHPDWGDRWSISFMADARFAGYKDEPAILPRVRDGSWYHGYLAEYSRRRSALVRFPLLPKQRVELEIHLEGPTATEPDP